jgi:spore coat polysaccharide biosynthesis predicted glycosyltransferase SpsG
MNRDPILIRVDGTAACGWERLGRCLTLAAALQRRRRPTFFLAQLDPGALGLAIKRAGNDWLEADAPAGSEEDVVETVQEIRRLRPAAVIVDAPNADGDYLAELVATGTLVVSLDHLAHTRFPSQLVINPLLAPGREAYEFLPGTQLLLGPRYALVRSEIRRARQIRAQEPAAPLRALLTLGDEDPESKAEELLAVLMNCSRLERIDLAVRPQHPELLRLRELAAAHAERLELAVEPAEITARLPRCHFAVSAGGTWSLELACVGIPQLLVVQSEAHWPTARRLEEEGAAMCLGSGAQVSAASVRQAIQELLNDPMERQAMSRCARKLVDGRGPDRLVTALEVLLHPSRLIDVQEAA